MQIFLKGKATYVVDVENDTTILQIKELIFKKEAIPARFLLLTAKMRCLEDENTLAYYGLGREDTIYFRVRAATGLDVMNL